MPYKLKEIGSRGRSNRKIVCLLACGRKIYGNYFATLFPFDQKYEGLNI